MRIKTLFNLTLAASVITPVLTLAGACSQSETNSNKTDATISNELVTNGKQPIGTWTNEVVAPKFVGKPYYDTLDIVVSDGWRPENFFTVTGSYSFPIWGWTKNGFPILNWTNDGVPVIGYGWLYKDGEYLPQGGIHQVTEANRIYKNDSNVLRKATFEFIKTKKVDVSYFGGAHSLTEPVVDQNKGVVDIMDLNLPAQWILVDKMEMFSFYYKLHPSSFNWYAKLD